jgi:hypothetical protein
MRTWLTDESPLQRFDGFSPVRATQGDLDQMSLLARESLGLIDSVRQVAEIVRDITRAADGG